MRMTQRAPVIFFCRIVMLPPALLLDRPDLLVWSQTVKFVYMAFDFEIGIVQKRQGFLFELWFIVHDDFLLFGTRFPTVMTLDTICLTARFINKNKIPSRARDWMMAARRGP